MCVYVYVYIVPPHKNEQGPTFFINCLIFFPDVNVILLYTAYGGVI